MGVKSGNAARNMMSDFLWRRDENMYRNSNQARGEIDAGQVTGVGRAKATKAAGADDHSGPAIMYARAATADGRAVKRDIHVTGVRISHGLKPLLEDAELKIIQGHRYGLSGVNGAGKSSLLKALAAREVQGFPEDVDFLLVGQEVRGDDQSVLDTVLRCDDDLSTALDTMATSMEGLDETAANALGEAKGEAEGDVSEGTTRASIILAGLGFSPEMIKAPTSSLSGGWRMRVSIACGLFLAPSIMCLDEPTNHLDLESVVWLQNHLSEYKGTLIIVSHDRVFLDNVVTDMMHLKSRKLTYYRGDFTTFQKSRVEHRKHLEREWARYTERRAHMQAFVDKFRFNAKRASLVQSRIKAIEKLDREAVPLEDEDKLIRFEFPDPGPLETPVMQAREASFGYPGKPLLFKDVEFGLFPGSRICLLGRNGAGKSTFLKLLLGDLSPSAGDIIRNGKLRTAYFTQHHMDVLDGDLTPTEQLCETFSGVKEDEARKFLGRFGITQELGSQRIGTLSGGQKSRVAFSLIAWRKPHILVLDEITNHLDVDTIDSVIDALKAFPGAVLLVSHDQFFVDAVATELWVLANCGIRRFRGTLGDYKAAVLAEQSGGGGGGD
jgi:ATP-binding cassette subfamily F protein 3